MASFTILGTDTDAGKTTFALLWLAVFGDKWNYWKPLETGESDSAKVRRLAPRANVLPTVAHFAEAVAPPLAARRSGQQIPSAAEIARVAPSSPNLIVETFGSPFSPLNDHELQLELIGLLAFPTVLVTSSKIGAVGRTLSTLQALRKHGRVPFAVVLMGPPDEYAAAEISKHGNVLVVSLLPPGIWTEASVLSSALDQVDALNRLEAGLHLCNAPKSTFGRSTFGESDEIWQIDRRDVWHPYTALQGADEPLRIVGAQDEFLHLADSTSIIDGTSSWWTILHGHREPRLMQALADAAESFDHVLFAGATHPPALRVADLLLKTAPWSGGRVFFSDNGSTAVEVALKMAYQFWLHHNEPRRTLYIGFDNGYHGDTFGAMAVGRDPLFFGNFEPLLFRTLRVPVSAERLDETLTQNAGRVAAVILEPLVQAAGGMRMHSPGELHAIHEVARKHGILFIADEVMTGCHRTGTMWAFQAAGIAPDLICAAKTLAGGILPLAATIIAPRIVEAFDTADRGRTFFHGHSFTAHPLACAIAAANLEWLRKEPPSAPANFESFWHESLSPLRERAGVRDIRIRGTVAAVELDIPGGYLAELGPRLRQHFRNAGVMLRPLGNVLYALPPFCTSRASLERIAATMKEAIQLYGGLTKSPSSK